MAAGDLAVAAQVAQALAAVAVAVYLWDRRRREVRDASVRERLARQARLVGACAVSTARTMRRGLRAQEASVRILERQSRDPPERPRRRVALVPPAHLR